MIKYIGTPKQFDSIHVHYAVQTYYSISCLCVWFFFWFFFIVVDQNCRNNVTYINSTVHTEGNDTYDCKYDDPKKNPRGVKRVDCFTGCNHKNGRPLCCRVKHEEYVNRTFSCTLRNTSKSASKPTPQTKSLKLLQLRKCECFYCDEVCSVKPAATESINSVNYKSEETNRVEGVWSIFFPPVASSFHSTTSSQQYNIYIQEFEVL